jgi:hypothetical protein
MLRAHVGEILPLDVLGRWRLSTIHTHTGQAMP